MRRGDVVLVALPGDHGKLRPAVVAQGDTLSAEDCGSVAVCPLTTTLTGTESFRVVVEASVENGLRQRSEVMVEKLAGVARPRLREVIGQLDRATMRAVERALLLVLGFAWGGRRHSPDDQEIARRGPDGPGRARAEPLAPHLPGCREAGRGWGIV